MSTGHIKACLAQCPDRAVLVLGLLLTCGAYLAVQNSAEDRQHAAVATQVGSLTELLSQRLAQYEDIVRHLPDGQTAGPADACPSLPGLLDLAIIPEDQAPLRGNLDDVKLSLRNSAPAYAGPASAPQVALRWLHPTNLDPSGRGFLFLPVQAKPASATGSADSIAPLRGWAVAVFDLEAMVESVTSARHVSAGVQLLPLRDRFGDPLPEPRPDDMAQVNYAGPRGAVASSVIVVGRQAWLVRWSVSAARATPRTAALSYAAAGLAASALLFLGKRAWCPFVDDRPRSRRVVCGTAGRDPLTQPY
jgi:hypothetical protein